MLDFTIPSKVKLFFGLIFSNLESFQKVKSILESNYGNIDFQSPIIDFNFTDYYQPEMGQNLKRTFISIEKLICSQEITRIKKFSVSLEKKFSKDKKRIINIDPGYITQANIILSTTKDFSHRIHIKDGIFAEVTLLYHDKQFKDLPWTFPDYRTKEYKEYFYKIRSIYRKQLK